MDTIQCFKILPRNARQRSLCGLSMKWAGGCTIAVPDARDAPDTPIALCRQCLVFDAAASRFALAL
jgi:hypothetical protein